MTWNRVESLRVNFAQIPAVRDPKGRAPEPHRRSECHPYLKQIGQIDLLTQLFGRNTVAQAFASELAAGPRLGLALQDQAPGGMGGYIADTSSWRNASYWLGAGGNPH